MQTDEALAQGIQQGRTPDLGVLVERHYSLLKGYLYRMTNGNLLLSEDMAQETFLRALRNIHQYQYPRPFKAWLYAIATNLVRHHFEQADTRHTITASEMDWHNLTDAAPLPEAQLVISEATRQVTHALAQLPLHQREAIVLRYYEEMPLAQIAEVLKIPEGTVKSRLSIGLRRLRELMEESA
ncbi:MAG: RNA polymerase sigma factor [Chloroflexi bacterium]|nr:RNA polymerase sigma factor [Chloroflexota bacterium]